MATAADELIWQNIGPAGANNQGTSFCAFKVKTVTQNFCRNQYNVSGLCSRQACPLANSKYATVREMEGSLYLFIKTPERAHTPKHLWEKIKLSTDYGKALEQIDSELMYFPSFLKHKCKQRTTKIVQYLIKIRKLRTRETGRLEVVKRKLERRETVREGKALNAARLEKNLEKELVARLKSRAYGDMPLNVNEDVWNAIMERERLAAEKEGEEDLLLEEDEDELEDEELEDEEEYESEREFVEDFDESDAEDLEDLEEASEEEDGSADDDEEEESSEDDEEAKGKGKGRKRGPAPPSSRKPPPAKKARGPRVEIEYEMEAPAREAMLA